MKYASFCKIYIYLFCFLCISNVLSAQIEVNWDMENTPCLCDDENRQPFQLIAEGDTGPFTFNWEGPNGYQSYFQSPTDITAPGDYAVTVTSEYGCTFVFDDLNIPACDPIQLNPTITPTCAGDNGSITLNASGGEEGLSFLWSNGIAAQNLMDLAAGSYTVTVSDGSSCGEIEETFTIENLQVPHYYDDPIVIHPSCQEGNDGRVVLRINPANNQYHYNWSDGVQGIGLDVRDNLNTGLYCVTITHNVSGCTVEDCFDLAPQGIQDVYPYVKRVTITKSGSNLLIYDGEWVNTSNDCIFFNGGMATLDDSTVEAMANGNMAWDLRVEFNKPAFNTSAFFSSVGFITLSGSEEVFTGTLNTNEVFQIAEGGLSEQIIIYGNDEAGNPLLDLRFASDDLDNCVIIPQLQDDCEWQPTLNTNWTENDDVHRLNLDCSELSLDIMAGQGQAGDVMCVSGSNAPIASAHWQTPNGPIVNSICVPAPTSSGEYCVMINDLNNCTASNCFDYCHPEHIERLIGIQSSSPCDFFSNGEICIVIEDPSAPIAFVWENGSTENCISNLSTGEYCVTITDLSCDLGESMIVKCIDLLPSNSSVPISINPIITPSCSGQNNGQICLDVSGGYPGRYTYSWLTGETTACISNLAATGCYQVTITDECGQTVTDCIVVPELVTEAPSLGLNAGGWACPGDNSNGGQIDLDFYGSLPPYSFIWDNGAESWHSTSPNLADPSPGQYTVSATDICGETYELGPVSIESEFNYIIEHDSEICDDGSGNAQVILLNLSEPIPSFEYNILWSTGASSQVGEVLSGFPVGNHSVTITETSPNYCEIVEDIEFVGYGQWEIKYEISHGCTNGSHLGELEAIHLETRDAEGNLTNPPWPTNNFELIEYIEWDDGSTDLNRENLAAGIYCYRAQLTSGCMAIGCVEILENEESPMIETAAISRPPAGGYIEIDVYGGSSQNTFLWSDGYAEQNNYGIGEGEYAVTVTNPENDCYDVENYTIENCDYLGGYMAYTIADVIVSPISEESGSDGSISLIINEGSEILYYHWTKIDDDEYHLYDTPIAANLTEGEYCVTISDGCGNIQEVCRLVVFCGNYDYAPDLSESYHDKPCFGVDGDWLTDDQRDGGITLHLGQEYGDETQFLWERYNQDGVAGWVFVSNERDLETRIPSEYRVTITDLTNCTHTYNVNLRTGFSDSENYFDLDNGQGQCVGGLFCNGTEILSSSADHVIQFDNTGFHILDGNPCRATVLCPLDGSTVATLISDSWDVQYMGPSDVDGYCVVSVSCDYDGLYTTELTNIGAAWNPELCSSSVTPPPPPPPGGGVDDMDNDGVPDVDDNCPNVYNPNQDEDEDMDGIGDACDCDSEIGAGVDSDGDDIPDSCDPYPHCADDQDSDGDGVPDLCDVCGTGNDNYDADGDGIPDACDHCPFDDDTTDSDEDLISDACDLCPYTQGFDIDAETTDTDGDGVGDACDPCPNTYDASIFSSPDVPGGVGFCDIDENGIPDVCDICPDWFNLNNSTGCCEPVPMLVSNNDGSTNEADEYEETKEYTSILSIENTTDLKQNEKLTVQAASLKLVPNPSSGSIVHYQISWNSNVSGEIVLFDARGTIFSHSYIERDPTSDLNKGTLQLNGISPGLYFVKATNKAGESVVEKLVITN